MENRISKRIYDLFQVREDPIRNLNKIRPILYELSRFRFRIEIPEPIELQNYKLSIQRTEKPLEAFTLLENCLHRFLSDEQLLEFGVTREFRDSTETFRSEVHNLIENLTKQHELLRFRITKENRQYFEELLQKLIGIRLEYELIPNLFEKMGFEKNSTTFNIGDKIIEVDGRYERKTYSGAREERLIGKDIIVVECKTTLKLSEVRKFEVKSKAILDKYVKEKENWNYDKLNFEAWMVACCGWKENLIEEAEARDIVPITPKRLEYELKKYKLYDPRIPICPTSD